MGTSDGGGVAVTAQPPPTSETVLSGTRMTPRCGCDAPRLVHLRSFRLEIPEDCPLSPDFDLVRCESCGLVLGVTPSTAEDFDKYYAAKYVYGHGHHAVSACDPTVELAFNTCKGLVSKDAPVVDVGCGNGELLARFKGDGFNNLTGIEASPGSCASLDRAGIRAMQGSLLQVSKTIHERFTLVTCLHVLEHVYDVSASLRALAKLIADDGYLYVEVPDSRNCPIHEPHQEISLEHINHFSMSTLIGLAHQAGLEVVRALRGQRDSAQSLQKMPVIVCVFQRQSDAIGDYLARSDAAYEAVLDRVRNASENSNTFCLWAAGQFCFKFLTDLIRLGVNVTQVVDDSPSRHGPMRGLDLHVRAYSEAVPCEKILITSFIWWLKIRDSIMDRFPHLGPRIVDIFQDVPR
jgi:SAM-dependent methyltransferase